MSPTYSLHLTLATATLRSNYSILWLTCLSEKIQPNILHLPQHGWSKKYWMDHIPEGERRVQMTVNTVCTFGYGVTAEGARKILEKMSSGKDEAYDVGLQHKCKSGELRCVVVLPQVLNHYEASEKLGYKSDIKAKSGEGSSASDELLGKTMGTTQNMVQSARCKAQFNSECLAPGTPPDIYG